MRLFNFGRNWRLSLTGIVGDDHTTHVGWWLNGRIAGWYVSCDSPTFIRYKRERHLHNRRRAFDAAWEAYKAATCEGKNEREALVLALFAHEDAG